MTSCRGDHVGGSYPGMTRSAFQDNLHLRISSKLTQTKGVSATLDKPRYGTIQQPSVPVPVPPQRLLYSHAQPHRPTRA